MMAAARHNEQSSQQHANMRLFVVSNIVCLAS
jgi:hypothetical protein